MNTSISEHSELHDDQRSLARPHLNVQGIAVPVFPIPIHTVNRQPSGQPYLAKRPPGMFKGSINLSGAQMVDCRAEVAALTAIRELVERGTLFASCPRISGAECAIVCGTLRLGRSRRSDAPRGGNQNF
jgi:hypothetical protein